MNCTPERRQLKGIKDPTTPTGAWKERFRQGCLKRLKDSRERLVNSFRHSPLGSPSSSQELVNQVMIHEWEQMKLESPLLSRLPQHLSCSKDEQFKFDDEDEVENIEDILNVFESIQQELLKEEQLMLAKYEDGVSFDEGFLCAAIDLLTTENVSCPVCKKYNLFQKSTVFLCKCGLSIDTQNPGIDLNFFHKQLNMTAAAHNNQCSSEPVYSLLDLSGINEKNLVMTCQMCDLMEIII